MSKVDKIYKSKLSKQALPVFTARISAGFPSPAADYEEGKLDLNKHLVKNPPATFFVRAAGDSMEGAGMGKVSTPTTMKESLLKDIVYWPEKKESLEYKEIGF